MSIQVDETYVSVYLNTFFKKGKNDWQTEQRERERHLPNQFGMRHSTTKPYGKQWRMVRLVCACFLGEVAILSMTHNPKRRPILTQPPDTLSRSFYLWGTIFSTAWNGLRTSNNIPESLDEGSRFSPLQVTLFHLLQPTAGKKPRRYTNDKVQQNK